VLKTKRLQFFAKLVQSMMTLLMKSAEVIIFRTINSQAKYYIASSTEDSVKPCSCTSCFQCFFVQAKYNTNTPTSSSSYLV